MTFAIERLPTFFKHRDNVSTSSFRRLECSNLDALLWVASASVSLHTHA